MKLPRAGNALYPSVMLRIEPVTAGLMATMLLACLAHAQAQAQPGRSSEAMQTTLDPAARERFAGLIALLNDTGDFDASFAPVFKDAVPRDRFAALSRQVRDTLGDAKAVESIEPISPWSARVSIRHERGVLRTAITAAPAAPHPITGLRLLGTEAAEPSVAAVVASLSALPGRTGFALARLGEGAPAVLATHDAARPMAIGSAFKLVILAELLRATRAGERRWDDAVTLTGMSLPGGAYTFRAKGTKISLRELAERMISVSDNSATDVLLTEIGRERAEAMLPVIGFTDTADRNRPFFGALEMFKLKGIDGGALGKRYLSLDPAGRRRMLDTEVAAAPVSALPATLFQDGVPIRIEELEWFASANDLIRAMDWLRRNSEGPQGAEVRAILSKNPGLPAAAGAWRYVGFKGGSEPGVINLTFLLQGKDGAWYAMAGSWNDPAKAVNEMQFTGLVGRALQLAAPAP